MQVDVAPYIALLIIAIVIIACSALVYTFELYRLHPGWSAVNKFDGLGSEDLRASQALIHTYVERGRDAAPVQEYVVSKGSFQTDASGLGYRWTKTIEDKVGEDCFAEWGSRVCGTEEGDGWLKVGAKYLPMSMEGMPVVHLQETQSYGSLGQCTWGRCEVPWQRRERIWHPVLGEVTLRHGFCDTQKLRSQSSHWARDEPHFIQATGLQPPQLVINEHDCSLPQRPMV
mmetsp:Transcript_23794/g.74877  ORF Transcript_23794/g.74877 Transcript_23794/m.74877 type:complete len:229 (+) Transcript_23794:130-816(+)